MLVYACSDLIFATKIRSTAEALGVVSRPVRNAEMLRARLQREDDGKANGPVTCVMIDLELGEPAFDLIKQVRAHGSKPSGVAAGGSVAEMRRLLEATAGGADGERPDEPTVIAFGPHVMREALAGAERVGADRVMARGAFTAELPELVRLYGE